MPSHNLERLAARNLIDPHRPTRREIENHLETARDFARAAGLRGVPERVRFQNLYEAAHSASLAGLKLAGYRAKEGEGNRQLTLSLAEQTLALPKGSSIAMGEANRIRGLMLYQGQDVDLPDSLLEALNEAVKVAIGEIPVRLKSAGLLRGEA